MRIRWLGFTALLMGQIGIQSVGWQLFYFWPVNEFFAASLSLQGIAIGSLLSYGVRFGFEFGQPIPPRWMTSQKSF